MNNQKGNQPNTPVNDQDLSNKKIDSLKEFNSTPIDTPTPMPLSDSLEPSKSLTGESLIVEEPKPELFPDPEIPPTPQTESLSEPEVELEPAPEINQKPLIDLNQETEVIPLSEVEPQPNPNLEPNSELETQPQPEPEVELKPQPDEYTSDPMPTVQTETNPPEPVSQDPEAIKQKIDEVLSYNSASSVVNSKSDTPKPPNLLKTLFTLSLIVFVAIAMGLAYFILNPSLKTNPETKVVPTTAPVQSNITCELNGFIYTLNQSFPSADGCNTCTCVSADNIECTEKICGDVTTTPATSSSIPKDWKTYTDSTYKFTINYSPEWVTKTFPEYKNIIVFQSPEGKKLEELSKSSPSGGAPYACGDYQIMCYKSFADMVSEIELQETKVNSLSGWLKTSLFKDFNQSTINNFTSYSVTQLGLSETNEFYIQNKDLSFCKITFCDRELSSTEKLFVNSFKFN